MASHQAPQPSPDATEQSTALASSAELTDGSSKKDAVHEFNEQTNYVTKKTIITVRIIVHLLTSLG